MESLNKLYLIGKKICGELGKDLVHHVYLKLPDKCIDKDIAYFVRVMQNEAYNQNSQFNKIYRPNYSELDYDVVSNDEEITYNYDANLLHRILLELEIEGFENEVAIYKEAVFVSSRRKVAVRLNRRQGTINKICLQISQEIKKRYEILNN